MSDRTGLTNEIVTVIPHKGERFKTRLLEIAPRNGAVEGRISYTNVHGKPDECWLPLRQIDRNPNL